MDDLRVPKQRVQVEVLLPGGTVRQVIVFLAETASAHAGQERLSDLLNGTQDFLPALDTATDQMTFLGRGSIASARVARELEPEVGPAATEQEVEITLVDGKTLRGSITYVRPPERSRLLDELNDSQPFVRLLEKDSVALVNKRHIARIAPLGRPN
jgi:hypothetical protein